MGSPQMGDWLAIHEEKFISFDEYKKMKPVRPTAGRNIIYIQPIGQFDSDERKLVNITAKYLEAFYGLKVKMLKDISDQAVPKESRRTTCYVEYDVVDGKLVEKPDSTKEQLHTQYILHEVLKPVLPSDAVVLLALCDKDLYPQESWNFVFGQASLKNRVGVWSFVRFGDVHSPKEFPLVMKRTLKVASHETGHMFSLNHCALYKCIMNGSNHLDESDSKPTYFCPECLGKFCWNLGQQPLQQFNRLYTFWKDLPDTSEVKNYSSFI